ncbi:MAG: leucine-rich repeat domain-containing protein, partial [Clostridia bacterium]|nr:leucine-rich repeat domain-containing protein [Clostridia bacterium]
YINDYAKRVKKKGAAFYFSFPPMNRLALTEDSYENRLQVYNALSEKLDCDIIGNIEDHIMDEGYFYDSNYHLNDSGVTYNTKVMVGDIKRQLGDSSEIKIEVLRPSGAQISDSDSDKDETYSEDFEYVEENAGWAIIAVKDSAKGKEILRTPQYYEGKPVYKIKEGAFVGIAAKSVNIGDNITVLEDGIFSGCDNLIAVNLSVKLGVNDILPSVGDNLLNGANPNLTIYVPSSKYGVMITDYFWMRYSQYLAVAK